MFYSLTKYLRRKEIIDSRITVMSDDRHALSREIVRQIISVKSIIQPDSFNSNKQWYAMCGLLITNPHNTISVCSR